MRVGGERHAPERGVVPGKVSLWPPRTEPGRQDLGRIGIPWPSWRCGTRRLLGFGYPRGYSGAVGGRPLGDAPGARSDRALPPVLFPLFRVARARGARGRSPGPPPAASRPPNRSVAGDVARPARAPEQPDGEGPGRWRSRRFRRAGATACSPARGRRRRRRHAGPGSAPSAAGNGATSQGGQGLGARGAEPASLARE